MKKILKHPLTIAVVPTVLGVVLTAIYDWAKGKPILSTIGKLMKWLFNILLTFLNYELKVWWVIVAVVVLGVICFGIVCFIAKTSEESQPDFLDYTKDYVLGWNWEWVWRKNYYDQYEIDELHAICSNCGTPITDHHGAYGDLKCVRCGQEYNQRYPKEYEVTTVIYDTAKRKLYRKSTDENN